MVLEIWLLFYRINHVSWEPIYQVLPILRNIIFVSTVAPPAIVVAEGVLAGVKIIPVVVSNLSGLSFCKAIN